LTTLYFAIDNPCFYYKVVFRGDSYNTQRTPYSTIISRHSVSSEGITHRKIRTVLRLTKHTITYLIVVTQQM